MLYAASINVSHRFLEHPPIPPLAAAPFYLQSSSQKTPEHGELQASFNDLQDFKHLRLCMIGGFCLFHGRTLIWLASLQLFRAYAFHGPILFGLHSGWEKAHVKLCLQSG